MQLPDLSRLTHEEKDALILALWAQVQALAAQVAEPGATHEKLWVEPDRLLLTSKQSSTLRTYAFSQPR